ncbi:MAG TPA: hypothetical protein VKP66_01310 [Steroidobacteraceae bacterium]|nr:hypothetical protein [Steroidobacteraceae bacterium]
MNRSFGVSVHPADGDNTGALLKVADEDMYHVKQMRREMQTSAVIRPMAAGA